MPEEAGRRAREWLDRVYGDLVTLTDTEPLAEGQLMWLFGCRYANDAAEPMLAATLAVPKDGASPFPLANFDPFDEELNASRPLGLGDEPWRWRLNARNCVVAADATVSQRPASALPWQPSDEAPGWWDRLLANHFPGSEVATCASWSEVLSAVEDSDPGTRGVVWLRRQVGGRPVTGHLLYVDRDIDGQVVVLDPQRGSLAEVNDAEVADLVLARFSRPAASVDDVIVPPWEVPAPELSAAVGKATTWLEQAYDDDVVLVDPDPADESQRGWLFACTTRRFQESGDWRDQMLDAGLVVPKAAGEEPFLLPNSDPWAWFARWDAGETGLPEPPSPGPATWYALLVQELGCQMRSTTAHEHWGGALRELKDFPADTQAMVWVRRKDRRGRESVGNLLVAEVLPDGLRLIDPMADYGQPRMDQDVSGLHVLRYERE
ncbi:MAG TPA: YrhB domain-containing protein [Pseudonocardiaceae bacterium]